MKSPREVLLDEILSDLREIERHCPCGARPESLVTHPHVIGCPVDLALEKCQKLEPMLVKSGHGPFELTPDETLDAKRSLLQESE